MRPREEIIRRIKKEKKRKNRCDALIVRWIIRID